MPPKKPKQLLRELKKRNKDRPADDDSMTAEGVKVPNPTRGEFFDALGKASKPDT